MKLGIAHDAWFPALQLTASGGVASSALGDLLRPASRGFVLNHSMVRVKDPAVALDFYTRIMGMRVLRKLDFPEMKFSLYFLAKVEDTGQVPEEIGQFGQTLDAALEKLVPGDIAALAEGKQRYSLLLADDGGILFGGRLHLRSQQQVLCPGLRQLDLQVPLVCHRPLTHRIQPLGPIGLLRQSNQARLVETLVFDGQNDAGSRLEQTLCKVHLLRQKTGLGKVSPRVLHLQQSQFFGAEQGLGHRHGATARNIVLQPLGVEVGFWKIRQPGLFRQGHVCAFFSQCGTVMRVILHGSLKVSHQVQCPDG